MLSRGDLHIHSTASDGSLNPGEIVKYAKLMGIDTISITDHNSVDGVSEAVTVGRMFGVSVIPAVEVSTEYKGESIHLLGYFKDGRFNNSIFQEILRHVKARRLKEGRSILRRFMDTASSGDHLTVYEGIGLLRRFGASVVLAHPVRISKGNLPEILNFPFDGIEGRYCNCSYSETQFFINTALSRYGFYTGGSDFHKKSGNSKTHCSIGNPCLNQMEIQMFLINSGAAAL